MWPATLQPCRYSLTKTWDRVLTMAEEVPLTKLAALLDSHVAFSSLAVEHRSAGALPIQIQLMPPAHLSQCFP